MQAVAISEAGGPEVLTVIDVPERTPGAGEVLIDVTAAAVNPADIGFRTAGGGDRPRPWIPGMEAAGLVAGVGESVDGFTLGDRVMAVVNPFLPNGGAQAEQVVVPGASVVRVPDDVDIEEAATLPMNGLTAMLGLQVLDLEPGQMLAVTGGAGQLASYVIPIAKQRGLGVLADAAPGDVDRVVGFGADDVVPRGEEFAAAVREVVPDGVDAVFDTAALDEHALGALTDGGELLTVRGWAPESTPRGIVVKQCFVRDAMDRNDWLSELARMASAGTIAPRVAARFAPRQAGQAQSLMEAGGLRGRAIILF